MVVKSERGRRRYIYFTIPEDIHHDDVFEVLSGVPSAKVITCSGGEAVVRCSPADKTAAIEAMTSGLEGCAPVLMSGTLRALRDKHSFLRVQNRRKKRALDAWSSVIPNLFIPRLLSQSR